MPLKQPTFPLFENQELSGYPKTLCRPIWVNTGHDEVADNTSIRVGHGSSPVKANGVAESNGSEGDNISSVEVDDQDADHHFSDIHRTPHRSQADGLSLQGRRSGYVKGGRPAFQKKVTGDLDSDDEIIFAMKNQGRKDKDIRARLVVEGRTRYNERTIGTRFTRLKRFKQKEKNAALDEDFTDWHVGDDEILQEAYKLYQAGYEKRLKSMQEKLWQAVAEEFEAKSGGVARFSKDACRDRFHAIENGTARMPPELDPDQESRQRERALKMEQNKQRKAERIAREEAKAQEELEKSRAREQQSAEVRARRKKREAEREKRSKQPAKAERKRAREEQYKQNLLKYREHKIQKENLIKERAVVKEKRMARKAEAQRDKRVRRAIESERNKMLTEGKRRVKLVDARMKRFEDEKERASNQQLLDKAILHAFGVLIKDGTFDDDAFDEHLEKENLRMRDLVMNCSGIKDFLDGKVPPGLPHDSKAVDGSNGEAIVETDKTLPDVCTKDGCATGPHIRGEAAVDPRSIIASPKETIHQLKSANGQSSKFNPAADPRYILKVRDLKIMCRNRGLPHGGPKGALVTSLAGADAEMTVAALRSKAKKAGIPSSGTRKILQMRMAAKDAELGANCGSKQNNKTKSMSVTTQ